MEVVVPPIYAFGSAVLTAIISVIGTIWVARARTRVDIGTTITTGFRELTDQLQEERTHLTHLIRDHRDQLAHANQIIDQQENTIRTLRRYIAEIEDRESGKERP